MLLENPWSRPSFTRTSNVFPDGPTETGHNGATSGEHKARNRTWGSHRARVPPVLSLLRILPPMACLCENHSSKRSFHHRLSPFRSPRLVRCYPLFPRFAPILTVSLITGAIRVGWTVLVHIVEIVGRAGRKFEAVAENRR